MYEKLEQFLSGYFHQDWTLDHATERSAMEEFLTQAPEAKKAAVANQIKQLLAATRSEAALGRRLLELGCYYDPTGEGSTVREWLETVHGRIEAGRGD